MKTRRYLHQQCSQLVLQLAQAQQRFLQNQDPAALHDWRVACRALRALLPIFTRPDSTKDQKAIRKLKQLAKCSNAARDLEMLVEKLGEEASSFGLHDKLQLEYTRLRSRLSKKPAKLKLIQDLIDARLKQKKLGKARQRHLLKLRHALALQLKHTKRAMDLPRQFASWHQLRIAVKRLRYGYEYSTPKPPEGWQSLKLAQQALGDLHDAELLSQYQTIDLAPLLNQARKQRAQLKRFNALYSGRGGHAA